MRGLALGLLLLLACPLAAADLVPTGQRVVFLGDSNTYAGRFIAYLDAFLATRHPERRVELLNLGLPSETVSGLSEADHPYPRPNVHDRLSAVLDKTKPKLVVVCYGMNDGIYSPFDEERFKKYQQGIFTFIAACEKAGAKVVLMTPAPFDAKPLKEKVLAKGAPKYSWLRPYEKYDEEVLTKYSEWLLTLREKGYPVADPHSAILKHLETMRKDEPNYRVSGDGIHPFRNGHFLIFRELLKALEIPVKTDAQRPKINMEKNTLGLTTHLPMPLDPTWHKNFVQVEKVIDTVGDDVLFLGGISKKKSLSVLEGDKTLFTRTEAEWISGVSLRANPDFGPNKKANEVLKLALEKQKVLGLAWLTDVGHKRPDTPKGIPLAQAETQVAELDKKIRELSKPSQTLLRLVPTDN